MAALGALLGVLVTLDHVVAQNEYLREAWGAYKGMIAYARADPAAFQSTEVRGRLEACYVLIHPTSELWAMFVRGGRSTRRGSNGFLSLWTLK